MPTPLNATPLNTTPLNTTPLNTTPLNAGAPASNRPEEILKATREFEALWIESMLHSARPDTSATLTGESDSTRDMVLDMADQQIARLLAAQGGLGLAGMIRQGLNSPPPKPQF